jgi:hypothetical protein
MLSREKRVGRIFTQSCCSTVPHCHPRTPNDCPAHRTAAARTGLPRLCTGQPAHGVPSSTIPLAPLVALAMAPSTLSAAQPLTRCGRAHSRRCRSRPEVRCGITGEVGGAGEKLIRLGFEENIKRYVVRGGGSCGPLGGKEKGPLWQV